MSETRHVGGPRRRPTGLSPKEWSLRRKIALAVLLPVALAAVLGALRVKNDLSDSSGYSDAASQVTVLRPVVDYLAAVETAIVIAREKTAADDPARDAAVKEVVAAGTAFQKAVAAADLTTDQQAAAKDLYDRSAQLRESVGYVSVNQSVAQLTQLQTATSNLIDTIVQEEQSPELKLELLGNVIDGRVSLALQQFAVAYQGPARDVNRVELAAEVGAEASAIDRIAAVLGTTDPDVSALRNQNAEHLGTVRDGGLDLGGADAYAAYDRLSADILSEIDAELTAAADTARRDAIVDSALVLAALLFTILLAMNVAQLLLDPIRRVREGALEVAQERLPRAVRIIRAGGDPGEVVPIDVNSREEIGQLARAVDDLHSEAVKLAVREAALADRIGEMFVTLSRRSTSLINQQLGLIEKLERDEEDPQRLESLFRLDHLASRMRRTADSLNILADAPPAPTDGRGLSVSDVLHAAIAGVQDYQRVDIEAAALEHVSGEAASDVVHMVTELVDNALSFSPPNTRVQVISKTTPSGVLLSVVDAGLGMQPDVFEALNAELASGGEVTPETARRMGLLVVARLAKRHGITV
ncbi:ATP-binding protein, partial [Nocardioides sp.]|uniref:sensor histidine kinase n=1 Tax=Nocardioides sp. TaxID=35761 RepID=UPI003568BD52